LSKSCLPLNNIKIFPPWSKTEASSIKINPNSNDFVMQYFPWQTLQKRFLKKFEIPFRNSYNFCNHLISSNPQTQFFYPINYLLLFLDIENLNFIKMLMNILIPFFFMFFILKRVDCSDYTATLGSIIYTFSGYFAAFRQLPSFIDTIVWIAPLCYYLMILEKMKINILKLSVILAFCFLGGHPQFFYYIFINLLIFFFFRIIKSKNIRIFFYGLIVFILFLILVLPQCYISYTGLSTVSRGAENLTYLKNFIFEVKHFFILLIDPYFYGKVNTPYFSNYIFSEKCLYFGIMPFLFLIYFCISKKNLKQYFYLYILLIFNLIILFQCPFFFNILYNNLYYFKNFRATTRVIPIIIFIFVIMTSLGIQNFIKNFYVNKRKIFLLNLILFLFTILIFYRLNFGFLEADLNLFKSNACNYFSLDYVKNYYNSNILRIFICICIIFCLLFLKNKKLYKYFLMIFISAELLSFNMNLIVFSDIKQLPKQGFIDFLKKDKDKNFRILRYKTDLLYAPNLNVIDNINDLQGYSAFINKDLCTLLNTFYTYTSPQDSIIEYADKFNRNSLEKLGYIGVKYILASEKIENFYLKEVYNREIKIYENKFYKEKIRFITTINKVNFQKQILVLFRKTNLNFENIFTNEKLENYDYDYENTSLNYFEELNEIKIMSCNNNAGFLLVNNVYDKNWRCLIDGKISKIYKVNYCFMGILLPKGKHEIVLKYKLKYFNLIYILSFLVLCISIFIALKIY
jgi:hypothetical protein